MRTWRTTLAAGVLVTLVAVAVPSQGQQVTIGTPYHNLQDSFFENSNISWSGHLNFQDNSPNHMYPNQGIAFSYGGGALALPQFGSPNLQAGLSANFAFVNKNGQINFATNFGQGSNRSSVTQTPSVTIMNGETGYTSNTAQTPFVMGAVPVVGGFPVWPQPAPQLTDDDAGAFDPRVQAMLQAHADAQQGPDGAPAPPQPNKAQKPDPAPVPIDAGAAAEQRLNAAQESTAGRPALSVAEAKRLYQQEQAAANSEMAALMVRAQALEEDGKPNVAKIYYQQVAKKASGDLQQQARTRLHELQDSAK